MAGLFGSNTLFSEVSGKVVIDGEAVSGALIEQWTKNSSGVAIERSMTTDESGEFHFSEISQSKGIADLLPSAFVCQQEINITHNGKKLTGWLYTKNDPSPGSETDGKEFSLVCDVGTEADYAGGYYGVCRLVAS